MKAHSLILPAIAATLLAGCFPAAVVGVGAGALMVADRRITETYLADEAIEMRASNRVSEKFGTETHVNVTSYNRMLLLTGEVPTAEAKAELGRIMAARFVEYNKFAANKIKVVTEWGSVFLLGLVTQREADDAVDIARTTGGVQKVVRLFEIIGDDEARRLDLTSSESKTPPAK